MDWNQLISISIAVVYLAIALIVFLYEPSKRSVILLVVVLVFIGVSLLMIRSDYGVGGSGGEVSHGRWRFTPPSLVRLCGWMLLLAPIWMPLIVLLIRWMG